MAKLDQTNRKVLAYQIEAIGNMGPAARDAIPVLRRWTDAQTVAQLSASDGLGHVVRWFDDPIPLPGGAAVALVQVGRKKLKGSEAASPRPSFPLLIVREAKATSTS